MFAYCGILWLAVSLTYNIHKPVVADISKLLQALAHSHELAVSSVSFAVLHVKKLSQIPSTYSRTATSKVHMFTS